METKNLQSVLEESKKFGVRTAEGKKAERCVRLALAASVLRSAFPAVCSCHPPWRVWFDPSAFENGLCRVAVLLHTAADRSPSPLYHANTNGQVMLHSAGHARQASRRARNEGQGAVAGRRARCHQVRAGVLVLAVRVLFVISESVTLLARSLGVLLVFGRDPR